MEKKKRKEDEQDGTARFRSSSRLFRLNDEWYFSTREGDHGPFRSETLAQKELNRFIKDVKPVEHDYIEIDQTPRSNPRVWDKYDQLN